MIDPASRPADDAALALSPFCTQLQSKKLYFLGRPPLTERDVLDASRHCWCRRTMQALGPDGEAVDPADCQNGRTCFEPIA